MLHTGKVLLFTYNESDRKRGDSAVLDPITGEETREPLDKDLFCGGQSFLSDGCLLVAGGHGEKRPENFRALYQFSPLGDGGKWTENSTPLSGPRWYPALTTLPDGRVLIISGTTKGPYDRDRSPVNSTYEIFDPVTGLQPPILAPIIQEAVPNSIYAFVFVLPSGHLFIHANNRTRFIHASNLATGDFENMLLFAKRPTSRSYPLEGSSVLLPLLPTSNLNRLRQKNQNSSRLEKETVLKITATTTTTRLYLESRNSLPASYNPSE